MTSSCTRQSQVRKVLHFRNGSKSDNCTRSAPVWHCTASSVQSVDKGCLKLCFPHSKYQILCRQKTIGPVASLSDCVRQTTGKCTPDARKGAHQTLGKVRARLRERCPPKYVNGTRQRSNRHTNRQSESTKCRQTSRSRSCYVATSGLEAVADL